MTKSEILFNYDQAMKQAAKLDNAAGRLDRLASGRLEDAVRTLRIAWQSDNSPQYCGKTGKVQGDMRATAGKIRGIARSIRSTATAVKNAELAALAIAQARTYK